MSYEIDKENEAIRYTTGRAIAAGEELCIFYGDKLWFNDVTGTVDHLQRSIDQETDDGWGGLSAVHNHAAGSVEDTDERWTALAGPFIEGDPDETVPEEDLPFTRMKTTLDEVEEEIPEAVRTCACAFLCYIMIPS